MATARPPTSFLPAIKCSNCGADVDLSLMGDHICSTSSQPEKGTQNPSNNSNSGRTPRLASQRERSFSRPAPPLRVDSSVANRPFHRPNELTPISSGTFPPTGGLYGRKSPSHVSQQSPSTRLPQSPPSPEYSNLDCAFPPFPVPIPRSATPVEEPAVPSSHFESDYVREHAEPYNQSRPGSPSSSRHSRARSMGGPRSRNRNGTVGSRADSVQRPSTANGRRKPSLADITRGPRLDREERPPLPSAASGNTASVAATKHRPAGLLAIKPGSSQAGGLVDLAMQRRPLSPNRSQTFPLHNEDRISGNGSNGFIARRPSEPSHTLPRGRSPAAPDTTSLRSMKGPGSTSRAYSPPDQNLSSETQAGISYPPAVTGNDRRIIPKNRPFHARNASRTDFRVDLTTSNHPPLPARTDIGVSGPTSTSHTSTESASSDVSGISAAQTNSSRSSPPPTDKGLARDQSNTTYRDQPRPAPLPDLALPTQHPLLFIPPESPTDPLCQQGRLSPIPRGRTNRSPFSMISSSSASSRASSRNPSSQDLPNSQRKASGSRGPCRGCSQPIIAGEKSISSKDGRLTGRYHKKCFVCHTCQGPFETADFYVHDDRPFCAAHYHALNGSLCSGCGKGIEGQYLEATDTKDKAAEKFHPSCLKCSTCHTSLQDDYFEWMGKVYCERDAKRAADVQVRSPSGLSPRPGPSPMSNLPINASPLGRSGLPSGLPSGPRAGLRPPGPSHESGPRNGFLSPFASNAGPRVPASGGRFPERRTTRLMMI